MKHKLSWVLKPTLSILDYEFLNSFFLQRESNENGESNYRVFLLKLAQGLVSDCISDDNEHVGGQGNSSKDQRYSPSYKIADYSKIFYVLKDRNSIARNRQFYNLVKRVGV